MADGFYAEGSSLYGNTDKTVGPTLPRGFNGGVVVGADADTVLTTSSGRRVVVTPTATRNYTLPTGVLELLGDTWTFVNLASSFSLVIKASDASTIATVLPNQTVQVFAKQDNPTTNTHWVLIGANGGYLYTEQLRTPALSVANTTPTNLTASPLSLTALGTWLVTFSVGLTAGADSENTAGISLVSATITGDAGIDYAALRTPSADVNTMFIQKRLVVAAPTTVYGVVNQTSGVAMNMTGILSAEYKAGA